jgi:hypothetical protein
MSDAIRASWPRRSACDRAYDGRRECRRGERCAAIALPSCGTDPQPRQRAGRLVAKVRAVRSCSERTARYPLLESPPPRSSSRRSGLRADLAPSWWAVRH